MRRASWLLIITLFSAPAAAQFETLTEYMSVKTSRANVRVNPREDAEIVWRMWKYMPVEIIAYRGDWRKIRDLDGDTGWMNKQTLAKIPTIMVKSKSANLRRSRMGKIEWILDRGYALRVFARKDDWLEVSDLSSVSGWIHVTTVWGMTDPDAQQ